jgi:hypothetical protein
MKEITAYKCQDGTIFEDELKAQSHENELLGIALADILYVLDPEASDYTTIACVTAAFKKRAALFDAVTQLKNILDYTDDITAED